MFKIAEIKVTLVDKMGTDLTTVNAARVSFGKSADTLTEKDQKLINYLAQHQHFSPFEHCVMTFLIECPLFIRSQIHRHRTFAFNEISRRYTSENIEFYIPPVDDIRVQSKSNKQASEGPMEFEDAILSKTMMEQITLLNFQTYEKLIQSGVSREQARMILPQSLMTQFYMTGNLRNLAHFIKLRSDNHAQKEVQYISNQMKEAVEVAFPYAAKALFEVT